TAVGYDAGAALVDEPPDVSSREFMIYLERLSKARGDSRHDALPIDDHRCSILTGKMGGRTDGGSQPKRNSDAGPQMRPWQGPIPHRVCNLASRKLVKSLRRPKVTSSHLQTMVLSSARIRSSSRSANERSIFSPKRRAR